MLSPRTKRNLSRILPFGIIWLVMGWIFLLVEYAAAGNRAENLPDTAIEMDWGIFLFSNILVTIVGLGIGSLEIAVFHRLFRGVSFTRKIIFKLVIYLLLMSLIILVAFPSAAAMELNLPLTDTRVWRKYGKFFFSITHLSTLFQMGLSLSVSLIYSEMAHIIGHRELHNLFIGKYHRPTLEERVFLFLDMKSSTTIAEKMGNIEFFELLKAYYADMTSAIIDHSAEVYQYVGDEIILSWTKKNAVLDNRCLRFFFSLKEDFSKRSGWYREKFGFVPEFKAGMHYGKVTTGEIGEIKKDLFFTGDVLNTTARIQGLCNSLDADFLISEQVYSLLSPNKEYAFLSLGKKELRGRKEKIEVYSVEVNQPHPLPVG